MSYLCAIDKQEFETESQFHKHIVYKLKTKLKDYYTTHAPKFDLFTGEPIPFKDKDTYFSSLFNSRDSMVQFFKKNQNDVATAKRIIQLRHVLKNFQRAPSTTECRTSIMPTPLLVSRIGGDYNVLCQDLGIPTRYDYHQSLEFEKINDLHVLYDTREQKPLKFPGGAIKSKLDFGDYTCRNIYKRVFIERKSLVDLCGTLAQGYERFQEELKRAADYKSYIVVCVEDDLNSLNFLKERPDTRYMKASQEFICARLRNLCQDFDNVQFLFLNGRVEMIKTITNIFKMKNNIRTVDLQFFYDKKEI